MPPPDASEHRAVSPTTVYTVDQLPPLDVPFYSAVRKGIRAANALRVPPRDARAFEGKAGQIFGITSVEGSQVGDLNLWNAHDLSERFFSGKTRALQATHTSTGDRLWSTLPSMRPVATITHDTLDCYGWDEDGGGIHDVIGMRCDPCTNQVLNGVNYHYFCHSNLTRAECGTPDATSRSGAARACCAECVHVHWIHA